MKLSDFKYSLSDKLIAQYPSNKRDKCRLMIVDREKETIEESLFTDIIDYIQEGDSLVINETKVFPARLEGTKDKTDAKVEVFLLRELEQGLWEVLVKPARKVRVGNRLSIGKDLTCDVIVTLFWGGGLLGFISGGVSSPLWTKSESHRYRPISNAIPSQWTKIVIRQSTHGFAGLSQHRPPVSISRMRC
jgi:S-adenosylmethionine:tRNA ribosyltransferase-isomerase